ncbi:hypothetical protein, partial [Modestobacter sp. KNN46-3]|uniref:hypothetical protein n=1 Tax=Modestobacter sp. KNN46-3 TaxID=2711218 RepID=UPI0013E00B68
MTTWGSSSHPTMPRAARVQDGELTLTIGRRETAPLPPGSVDVMTADLASHTTLIEPPAGLDPHTPTRVRVVGLHRLALQFGAVLERLVGQVRVLGVLAAVPGGRLL